MSNPRPRDVFPLRFKNPATREALKHLSEQLGLPMTDIAELAIEHEVVLQGSDLERRLEEALEVVRGYSPTRDSRTYIDAVAAGERLGPDPFRDVQAAHAVGKAGPPQTSVNDDPYGVLAAFSRS